MYVCVCVCVCVFIYFRLFTSLDFKTKIDINLTRLFDLIWFGFMVYQPL